MALYFTSHTILKIVILGSGDVGSSLSLMLAREKQDVTVVDQDLSALQSCSESNDILTIQGNATSPNVLVKAGVRKADLVIAATHSDEVNIVASTIAKRLGARKVIARVRDDEIFGNDCPIHPSDFGIDVVINPELSLAQEITLLVKRAAATDLVELADGKMQVIGIRLPKQSPVNNLSLAEYAQKNSNIDFRVVAIHRGSVTIIPSGDDKLRANDQIFVIALSKDIKQIIRSVGIGEKAVQDIMIAGGTKVGRRVSQMLQHAGEGWKIKLIEPDYDTSYDVACEQRNILVLNGDPTDPSLLASEGIIDTDVFIAVTNDEESNIISCLMAKHLKVAKAIAMVSKPEYIPLSQTIGLDASVNKKNAISNHIHEIILGDNLLKVAALNGIDAEILQIRISSSSKLVGKAINKLSLKECTIGGYVRNGSAHIATGRSELMPNDDILVFCKHSAINDVVNYLQ